MTNLRYAVIALKKNEVDQVVNQLAGSPFDPVARWLEQSKDLFYGPGNEDWKPFNGKTIDALINETKGQYSNQTNLVNDFKQRNRNYDVVSPIRVYFIDAFALFHDKYFTLVNKLDALMAVQNQCCLVISNDWPKDIQQGALAKYSEVMSEVYDKYRKGRLHRIAMREDDLKNFRNYLFNTIGQEDLPAISKEAEIKKKLPFETETVPGRDN
jgi:hypothetical protein